MKMLFVAACCAFLAGCAAYAPTQQDVSALITPDSMRTYRPLPAEERRVDICTMSGQTVRCR